MTPRTPEERERMMGLLFVAEFPLAERSPIEPGSFMWQKYDRLLAAFPQLWDSLPPDPAEQARKEAEEDGRKVGRHRRLLPDCELLPVIDRMSARAAAGHPVLIAPKGESPHA